MKGLHSLVEVSTIWNNEKALAHFSLTLVEKYGNHRTKTRSCGIAKSPNIGIFQIFRDFWDR